MKTSLLITAVIGAITGYIISPSLKNNEVIAAGKEPEKEQIQSEEKTIIYPIPENIAGHYLIGIHAQSNHDWKTAEKYISKILDKDKNNPALMKRAMIMAMGSGNYDKAIIFAKKIKENEQSDDLASILLTLKYIKNSEYEKALKNIKDNNNEGISILVSPVIKSWAKAGKGQLDIDNLITTSGNLYHSILIAAYLNKLDEWEKKFDKIQKNSISSYDLERIADHLVRNNKKDKAYELYEIIIKNSPKYKTLIKKKINAVKENNYSKYIKEINITSPTQGISFALYDIALMLFQENSDDSARIFNSMALYLTPDMAEAKLLMANIAARNKQIDKAVKYYTSIKEGNNLYTISRRYAADVLSEEKRYEEAINILKEIVDKYQDINAQIMIGDLLRQDKKYKESIKEYNKAFNMIGKKFPDKYWHLYYSRGISYERLKKWEQAEKDFKKALEYQPNNPYVLNYLGYSWADQNINLEQALEMIEKAAKQAPNDAYIIDSLGWVMYKMGKYKDAIPPLEKAVELSPYDPVINDHLGDAYWRIGRKLEARFQWKRAINYANEDIDIEKVKEKIKNGIKEKEIKKAEATQSKATPPQ